MDIALLLSAAQSTDSHERSFSSSNYSVATHTTYPTYSPQTDYASTPQPYKVAHQNEDVHQSTGLATAYQPTPTQTCLPSISRLTGEPAPNAPLHQSINPKTHATSPFHPVPESIKKDEGYQSHSSQEDQETTDDPSQLSLVATAAASLAALSSNFLADVRQRAGSQEGTAKRDGKPFCCAYNGCDATFGQKGSLTRHVRSRHEKLRPHTCPLCRKSFSALWTLRVHQRNVHLKSKPHKCHLCDKSFGELFNKSKHIAIVHEGKRPYACPICSRAFGYKGDMRKHVLELHEQSGRPFQCVIPSCGVKFARKRYLRRHENLSHRGHPMLANRDTSLMIEGSPTMSQDGSQDNEDRNSIDEDMEVVDGEQVGMGPVGESIPPENLGKTEFCVRNSRGTPSRMVLSS